MRKLAALEKGSCDFDVALDKKGHDSAEAVHLFGRKFVLRMGLKTGIQNTSTRSSCSSHSAIRIELSQ